MENLKTLSEELDKYREELENDNFEVEQNVVDLEDTIVRVIDSLPESEDVKPYKTLLTELKAMKKEFDFYDPEGELDMMFPDRHDDDFDEDSMSFDSVFGKD